MLLQQKNKTKHKFGNRELVFFLNGQNIATKYDVYLETALDVTIDTSFIISFMFCVLYY